MPALLYFLLAYALANRRVRLAIELRGRGPREAYAGLGPARPGLALSLLVSFLSFVGIPPLAGFTTKVALFTAAIDARYEWLAVLAALNTVVSLAYYARVLGPAYFAAAPGPVPVLGRASAAATIACALAVVALGIAAGPLLDALGRARLLPG